MPRRSCRRGRVRRQKRGAEVSKVFGHTWRGSGNRRWSHRAPSRSPGVEATAAVSEIAGAGPRAFARLPKTAGEYHPTQDTIQQPIIAPEAPTADSARMVAASIAGLAGREVEVSQAFRAYLFSSLPPGRPLTVDVRGEDVRKFVHVLLEVMASLDDPGSAERLEALGARLETCAVPDEYYLLGARALVRSVRDLSPESWSTLLGSSWVSVQSWAVAQMLAGAHRSRQMTAHRSPTHLRPARTRTAGSALPWLPVGMAWFSGWMRRVPELARGKGNTLRRPSRSPGGSWPRWQTSRLNNPYLLRLTAALLLLGLAATAAMVGSQVSLDSGSTDGGQTISSMSAEPGPILPPTPADSGPSSTSTAAATSSGSPISVASSTSAQVIPVQSATGTTASSCQVDYTFDSVWGDGFVVTIVYTNTSTTAWSGWSGRFGMSSAATVQSSWGADLSASGGSVLVTPADYNSSVAVGDSVTVGFQAETTASVTTLGPFSVNGKTCS